MPDDLSARARAKPLVLLEEGDSASLVGQRQLALPEDLADLPQRRPRPEQCLLALLDDGRHDDAAVLLGGFLRRRVAALWGWWCVQQTVQAAAALAAEAADAPAPAAAGPAPLGITAADLAPPPAGEVEALKDPAAWPEVRIADGRLEWLPAALQDQPGRPRTLAEDLVARQHAHLAGLPPAERAAAESRLAAGRERLYALCGGPPRDLLVQGFAARLQARNAAQAQAQEPFTRLEQALDARQAGVRARLAEVQGRLAAMRARLPRRPDRGDPASPRVMAALEAARRWLLAPDQTTGWAAFTAGRACADREMPAGLVAQACFWSGTSLQPPGSGQDLHPVPPPPPLAPRAIATALVLARNLPGSGREPAQWLEQYLGWGIEIAQGLLTLDRLLALGERPPSPWAGRAGFGRQVAKPDGGAPAWSIQAPPRP
ncbi:MAG: hypothetical protein L6R48_11140 [Planctomycetes bacterium]|nr:hypothetical protein [Planctomycetota bacterium]